MAAAATANVSQMLNGLGLSQDVSTAIVSQGYTSLDEFKLLEDDDDVQDLCRIVRKPGGQVTTGRGVNAVTTADPGIKVTLVAETNLKLACFYMRHMLNRISRDIVPNDVTVINIHTLRDLYKSEKDYTFPKKETFPKIDERSWPDTLRILQPNLLRFKSKRNPNPANQLNRINNSK